MTMYCNVYTFLAAPSVHVYLIDEFCLGESQVSEQLWQILMLSKMYSSFPYKNAHTVPGVTV